MAADYQLWIDGRSVDAASGETFETFDPSTGQAHATVARAGQADVDRAVAAARAAFEDGRWSGLRPERRAAVLQAVAARLKEQAPRLVDLEVRDAGGTIRKTRSSDVAGAAFTFRTYAELATRLPAELPLPFTVAPGPATTTCAASRSGSARPSSPGTSPSRTRPGSWPRPWPPATRWS